MTTAVVPTSHPEGDDVVHHGPADRDGESGDGGSPGYAPLTLGDGDAPTPRWAWPAYGVLVVGTGLLYLVGLGASGNANSFYAAAVQAGTLSWKAFFFGSIDSSNFITVDKPPMSLWPMEIAGRIFGFDSWSMLAPQALMGVASVALLVLTVRRWFGWTAGLLAGLVLALTPVAVLMFRFNNPDALMVLLLVGGAWALTRALESGKLRWLLLLGVSFGFGFLTKGLQPFTVLPAFAFAYLLFAPTGWGRRIVQLLLGGLAVVVSAGWWVVAVLLWPAADRPYIGGSTNNNPLELAFGYNGLGRLTGNEFGGTGGTGGAGGGGFTGGGGGPSFSGSTGLGRLFNSEMGGQISWLLPAALLAAVALAVVGVRARRAGTDTRRLLGATVVWGGWLVVTGAVLSFASGTIHSYYTVQLAPAIAALVGIGVVVAWRMRHHAASRVLVAVAVAVTAFWAFALLGRSADYWPVLRWVVLVVGVLGAVAVLAGPALTGAIRRPVALATAAALVVAGLGAPTAYAATTAATPHTGSTPSAGPETAGGFGGGFGGGSGARGGFGGPGGSGTTGGSGSAGGNGGFPGAAGGFPGGESGQGGFPGGTGTGGTVSGPTGSGGAGGFPGGGTPPTGTAPGDGTGGTGGTGSTGTGGSGGGGSGGGGTSVDSALAALLTASDTRWAAATIGAQTAASWELASGGAPVMAIGGFTGSDPSITLAQFQQRVAAGEIHYFVSGGMGGMGGRSGDSSEISSWVAANFTATTVGGSTVYDLTASSSS